MPEQFVSPQQIAEAGLRIYDRKYKGKFEQDFPGQFVAIDVTTEKAYVQPKADDALKEAEKDSPQGKYYLIRIGSQSAFKVSFVLDGNRRRLLRTAGQPCL